MYLEMLPAERAMRTREGWGGKSGRPNMSELWERAGIYARADSGMIQNDRNDETNLTGMFLNFVISSLADDVTYGWRIFVPSGCFKPCGAAGASVPQRL